MRTQAGLDADEPRTYGLFICITCGKEFVRNSGSQRMCGACGVEFRTKDSSRRNKLRYQAKGEEIKERSRAWRKRNPEFMSVQHHHAYIFDVRNSNNTSYAGMPFFDSWNPHTGGSFRAGSDWIVANLGKRPDGCSLHIIHHDIGFMPGNLEWTHPRKQIGQQMHKIIAQQRHRIRELEARIAELEKRKC